MRDTLESIGEVLVVFLIFTLVIALIMIPIVRNSLNAELYRYEAFKQTLENARIEDVSELERAAILDMIAIWNMDIAKVRHYNKTILGIYIPDEVTELEFLK